MNRYRFRQLACGAGSLLLTASLLPALLFGCGKGSEGQTSNSATFQREGRYWDESLYQVGDQVRLLVTESDPRGSRQYEMTTVVSQVGPQQSQYFIEKFKTENSVRSSVFAAWKPADALFEMAITSGQKLKESCRRGKIEKITLGSQTVSACYRVEPYPPGSQIQGRCQYWLGVIPFGVLKMSCASSDGRSHLSVVALSAVQQGSASFFD